MDEKKRNPNHTRAGPLQKAAPHIPTWPLYILVALAILFSTTPRDRYVICSESNNIYTVAEPHPRVQCLSVKGSEISDTGTLGVPARSWIIVFPFEPS